MRLDDKRPIWPHLPPSHLKRPLQGEDGTSHQITTKSITPKVSTKILSLNNDEEGIGIPDGSEGNNDSDRIFNLRESCYFYHNPLRSNDREDLEEDCNHPSDYDEYSCGAFMSPFCETRFPPRNFKDIEVVILV